MHDAGFGFKAFCDMLRAHGSFEAGLPITVSRAPGRLDVMGGIADYSGSLVLQRPIAEAAFCAVQRIDTPSLELFSVGREACTIPLDALMPGGIPVDYDAARRMFADDGVAGREGPTFPHWASYVAGPCLVLARELGTWPAAGLRVLVASEVPEGKGVSSSAAVETSTMTAIARACEREVAPRDLALLCQRSENLVSGAPCGVMDQMACVFGEPNHLMALLCQPAQFHPPVAIPDDLEFWGIDSGERHAVGGSDYGTVRTGAFMGLRILQVDHGVTDPYLANITSLEFDRDLAASLPEEISGAGFLARYGDTADTVTRVEPGRRYRVRAPAAHPVYERERAESFRQLLGEAPVQERRVLLGELMFRSHDGYVRCGLGSPGTDCLVELVRQEGPKAGLYGARITGGGSGGTVAVVGRRDAAAAIGRVVDTYERQRGYRPAVFAGSSPGVVTFGTRSLTL